jgi:HEAT repeat protein
MASMLKRFRLRIRLRVRTLLALVAIFALGLWGVLMTFSPTRRLGRLVRADQPAYVRREAAALLGHQIPPWEVDEAVRILIRVCDDPSPRVRESAAAGFWQLETKAEAGVPKLLELLHDDDRYVRFAAAGALGRVVQSASGRCPEVAEALVATLNEPDFQVRLRAAASLCGMGRTREAIGTLADALGGYDQYLRAQARSFMTREIPRRPLVDGLMPELSTKNSVRRQGALDALLLIAGPDVIEAGLESAAGSADPETRRWATSKLERLRYRLPASGGIGQNAAGPP